MAAREVGLRAANDAIAIWRAIKDWRDVEIEIHTGEFEMPWRRKKLREEAAQYLATHPNDATESRCARRRVELLERGAKSARRAAANFAHLPPNPDAHRAARHRAVWGEIFPKSRCASKSQPVFAYAVRQHNQRQSRLLRHARGAGAAATKSGSRTRHERLFAGRKHRRRAGAGKSSIAATIGLEGLTKLRLNSAKARPRLSAT